MSKKKTGEFEMTYQERKAHIDSIVASNIANHYQKVAAYYTETAMRKQAHFWDLIKDRDNLPKKHYSIEILPGDRLIKISLTPKEEQGRFIFKRPEPTKEFNGD